MLDSKTQSYILVFLCEKYQVTFSKIYSEEDKEKIRNRCVFLLLPTVLAVGSLGFLFDEMLGLIVCLMLGAIFVTFYYERKFLQSDYFHELINPKSEIYQNRLTEIIQKDVKQQLERYTTIKCEL